MEFAPSSTIWLLQVPFDNSYKHVIRFPGGEGKDDYFENSNRVKKIFTDYTVVKKPTINGGYSRRLKVRANIEELMGVCNYMVYYNANHSGNNYSPTKIYAFITDFIYVDEQTTEIVFETDVYQTWMNKCTFNACFVLREHSASDEIGDNVVPECFDVGDFTYTTIGQPVELINRGYLIASSSPHDDSKARGVLHSGVYQGLYFYYATNPIDINNTLDLLEEKNSDCVVSITAVPNFCWVKDGASISGIKFLTQTEEPTVCDYVVDFSSRSIKFEGYEPKNKKLYTAPFFGIEVSNNIGETRFYKMEDFANRNHMAFLIVGSVSAVPSVYMYPAQYKNCDILLDEGMSLGVFPQCAYNSDSFKLWMNKNFTPSVLSAGASMVTGSLMGAASGGAIGAVMGFGAGLSAVTGVLGEMGRAYKDANRYSPGNPSNTLITGMDENTYTFRYRTIKKAYARAIDDYFTMYGYQVNRVKVPERNSRSNFNYVQTMGANIYGPVPTPDLERLKKIFDDGVTLWSKNAPFCDYDVNNFPIGGGNG